MNSEQIKNLDNEYIVHSYNRFDVVFDHGENARIFDKDGKEYIDLTSGIGVNSLGFCNKGWIEAITAQLGRLQHSSNLFFHEPGVALAEKLAKRSGLRKVFFCNSGAEANETAIKIARKYGKQGDRERINIVSFNNAFHGRTFGSLTATGRYMDAFVPCVPGFVHTDINDIDQLKQVVENDDPVAVIAEMIQGEGGLINLDEDFVKEMYQLCRDKDILLIVDEVQSGIGRTGKFFSYEHYGIEPDIVSFAKGIGGGLPLGGVVCGDRTCDVLEPGDHGTTFGMNPVISAGANYVVDTIDDAFLAEVNRKAEYIRAELEKLDEVSGTTGLGLMIGIDLKTKKNADVLASLRENGVLVLTAGTRIRLLPPLTITDEDIDQALEAFRKVL